ncbi:MAG: hypothetical protein AAF217_15490, partial [Pseudomonadota bacterium]
MPAIFLPTGYKYTAYQKIGYKKYFHAFLIDKYVAIGYIIFISAMKRTYWKENQMTVKEDFELELVKAQTAL